MDLLNDHSPRTPESRTRGRPAHRPLRPHLARPTPGRRLVRGHLRELHGLGRAGRGTCSSRSPSATRSSCTACRCRSAAPTRSTSTISRKLRTLARRVNARWISDHLCWTGVAGRNTHDLLPFRSTRRRWRTSSPASALVQDFLERPLVLENPSSYVTFADSTMSEWEFSSRLADDDRLRPAARREQRLRLEREPRFRPAGTTFATCRTSGSCSSTWRATRCGHAPGRHARRPRGRSGLGALSAGPSAHRRRRRRCSNGTPTFRSFQSCMPRCSRRSRFSRIRSEKHTNQLNTGMTAFDEQTSFPHPAVYVAAQAE